MTENWDELEKLHGRVEQVQVERSDDGGVLLCGVMPKGSSKMAHFIARLTVCDPVTPAQAQLLRDALLGNRMVRIAYRKSGDGGAHKLVAVRLHVEPAEISAP